MSNQHIFSSVSKEELKVLYDLYSDVTRSEDSIICLHDIQLDQLHIPEDTIIQQTLKLPPKQTILQNAHLTIVALACNQDKNKLLSIFTDMVSGVSGHTELWLAPTSPKGNQQCLSITYRILKNSDDLPIKAYLFCQNITHLKFKEKQYNELMQELSTAIPYSLLSVRMNITTGACGDIHGSSPLVKDSSSISTIESFCAKFTKNIAGDDNKFAFNTLFNRQNLQKMFQADKKKLSFDYQRLFDREHCVWATLCLTMGQNPITRNIEAVAYVRNNDSKRKKELIISHLTNDNYDFVAILDPRTDLLTFNTASTSADYLKQTPPPHTWQHSWYPFIIKMSAPKYKSAVTKGLALPLIIDQITDNSNYTFSFIYKKGSKRLHKTMSFCWLDATKQFILITAIDNTQLYKQQVQQNRKLQSALLNAEQANEAKSNFMATVSHDMRTPLNGILGFTSLAKECTDINKIQEYLSKIETSGNLLKTLINDTLELSKIESGKYDLQMENTNLIELLEEILIPVRASAEDKQLKVITDIDQLSNQYVITDSAKIKKILLNLISNALKFTPSGGSITIKLETLTPPIKNYNVKFTIKDTGIGISRSFLPKMFEPFEQEQGSRTNNTNGTGLGLFIVKKLVTLMNGTIEVTSEKNVGTSFFLYFHFNSGIIIGKMKQDIPDFLDLVFSNKKILICEDNVFNMEIAKALITKKNMIPVCAQNGKEGVSIFNKSAPNELSLILMDIHMPVMDGLEATAEIRNSSHPDAKKIPILAMTADVYDEDIKKCLATGMNDHIAKPFDPRSLFEKIAIAIMDREKSQ
ncbi:MAG: response regulator [Treponema sp.]|nr:response regulator [Treponema sp.]